MTALLLCLLTPWADDAPADALAKAMLPIYSRVWVANSFQLS